MMVAIVFIFCIFIAPLSLILHYTSGRRRAQGLTSDDEKMLSDLWQIANRMEDRVATLETILDKQAPNWRDQACTGQKRGSGHAAGTVIPSAT